MFVFLMLYAMPSRGSGFFVCRQAIIEIAAQAEIEGPASFRDRVLHVKSQFLHVGVAVKGVKPPSACQVVGSRMGLKLGY